MPSASSLCSFLWLLHVGVMALLLGGSGVVLGECPVGSSVSVSLTHGNYASYLGCENLKSLTLTLSASSTYNVTFGSLTQINAGNLIVTFGGPAIISDLSFPLLSQVFGYIQIQMAYSNSAINRIFLPAIAYVQSNFNFLATSGALNGPITIGHQSHGLSVGGDILFRTQAAANTPIADIKIEGLTNVSTVQLDAQSSTIGKLEINKLSPNASLAVSNNIYITTSAASSGAIGDVSVYGLATVKAIYVVSYASKIGNLLFKRGLGQPFTVTYQATFETTQSASNGGLGSIVLEGISLLTGLYISPKAAHIGDFLVNSLSPGVNLTIVGDLNLQTSPDVGKLGNVYVRGLVSITKSLYISPQQGVLGSVTINSETDGCNNLQIGGLVYISSTSYSSGKVGNILINGLFSVSTSLTIASVAGALQDVTIGRFGSCTGGFSASTIVISTSADPGGTTGYLKLANVGAITGNVYITKDAGDMNFIDISGSDGTPMTVGGQLAISTTADTRGQIHGVSISNLAHAASVYISVVACQISYITLSGHSSGFIIDGAFTLLGDYYNTGKLDTLMVKNISAIGTGLIFPNVNAQFGDISFLGHSSGFSMGKVQVYGNGEYPGKVTTLTFTGVTSVANSILVDPSYTQIQKFYFFGQQAVVAGSITVNLPTVNNGNSGSFFFAGLLSVGSKVSVNGAVYSQSLVVMINNHTGDGIYPVTNPFLTIGGNLDVLTNARISVSNLYKVSGSVNIQAPFNYAYFANPVYVSANPSKYLDIFGTLKVWSDTTANRIVTISNLRIVRGGSNTLTSSSFISVYRSLTSYSIGTVSINGEVFSSGQYTGPYYSSSPNNNDPQCSNYCYGRGSAAYLTGGSVCGNCSCWQYTNGTRCQNELACEVTPTCDCKCSTWSSWTSVGVNAAYRNRSCSSAPTSLNCSVIELQGSVTCQTSEYELTPPTPSSFRVCKSLTTCDQGLQYESKPPTPTSNRNCTALLFCTDNQQYQSTPPTPTSNRGCTSFSTCSSNQYILIPGSQTSDVVCQNCTSCGGGIVLTPCSQTQDATCQDCSPCDLTTNYIATECSPSLGINTVCNACKGCNNLFEYKVASCSRNNNTICRNYTTCVIGVQYQDILGTPTSDRHCSDLDVCNTNPEIEYMVAAPTPTSNRVCTLTSTCSSSQYQTKAPTPTSNRACLPLSSFNSLTQYISVPNTPTTDRIIKNLTTCTGLQFQSSPPTLTSDRHCSTARVCTVDMEYQTTPKTLTSDRNCSLLTVCTNGTIVYSPPTPTSDRVCVSNTECTAWQYESMPASTTPRVCSNLTTCFYNQYQDVAPTLTTDRHCKTYIPCSSTTEYEAVPRTFTSNAVCAYVRTCNFTNNEFISENPTPTSDCVCGGIRLCDANSEFQTAPPTPSSDRGCSPLSVCNGTSYQKTAPTSTTDRACVSLTVCGVGTHYESVAATLTTDRQCLPATTCTPGAAYQSADLTQTSDRVCLPIDTCSASQYEYRAPTYTSNRVCFPITNCYSSQYQTKASTPTSNRVCSSLTVCLGYQKESKAPSLTSDRKCVNDYCHKISPCQNNATCSNVGATGYKCACELPYYGAVCNIKYASCLEIENLCVDGQCYKNSTGANTFCVCPLGLYGELCQNGTYTSGPDASSSSSSSASLFIGVGAGVGVGLLFIVVLIVVLVKRRHNRLSPALRQSSGPMYFENKAFDGDSSKGSGLYYESTGGSTYQTPSLKSGDSNAYLVPQRAPRGGQDGGDYYDSVPNYEEPVSSSTPMYEEPVPNPTYGSSVHQYEAPQQQKGNNHKKLAGTSSNGVYDIAEGGGNGDLYDIAENNNSNDKAPLEGNYDVADNSVKANDGLYDIAEGGPATKNASDGLYEIAQNNSADDPNESFGFYDTAQPSSPLRRASTTDPSDVDQENRVQDGGEFYDNVQGDVMVDVPKTSSSNGYLRIGED